MTGFLLLAFIFLAAGVVAVPIASKLGLGSVLGYLVAGIVISPLLSTLGIDVVEIQHFAEFGVVMMLFLVGLELEPRMLWAMRNKLLGLGGLQVVGTSLAVMAVAMAFGQPWTVALTIGMVFSLSSTAIVLQTLNEKGLMRSDGGQSSFSVLLFQDIAVIPMLAFIPLLAMPELIEAASHGAAHSGEGGHEAAISLVAGLNGWQTALVTLGAIAAVVLGGIYLTRPLFRFIAVAELRELFTATALFFVIGIALLMSLVGLSPALGTFLAGVVLANSEYRHELESDIDPFRGLLLGLFFITVGAGINFALLGENLLLILGLTVGLLLLKAIVLLVLARIFKLRGSDKWLFGLGLAQAGEFGFVLLSFTVANNVIPRDLSEILLLVVASTMLLTPALFILYDRVIAPRYAGNGERAADEIDEEGEIIVAGHGRWGGIVNRMLLSAGYKTVVLDYSSAQLEMLRTFGIKVFFGDATRPDLLHSAGIAKARMLVVAVDDKEKATELVRYVNKNHPNVYIVARAHDRNHVYDLYAAGCRDIIRDTFDSAVRAGRSAWEALGMHAFQAEQKSRDFVRDDRKGLVEMARLYDPDIPVTENKAYVEKGRELVARQRAQLLGSDPDLSDQSARAWMPPGERDADSQNDIEE